MSILKLIILFWFFTIISCNEKEQKAIYYFVDYTRSPTYIKPLDTLNFYIDKAINKGDINALGMLSSHFFLSERKNEFFFYLFLYKNKYGANAYIYHKLGTCIMLNKKLLDPITTKIGVYYQIKAAELDSLRFYNSVDKDYIAKKDKFPNSEELLRNKGDEEIRFKLFDVFSIIFPLTGASISEE
jgi:hypothetical protein